MQGNSQDSQSEAQDKMSRQSRALQVRAAADSPPQGISESDYEAIEDAVMETARGRWFLKEFARRMRAAETAGLLTALQRIEKMVADQSVLSPPLAFTDIARRMEGISERLLDTSWYMRERGIDNSACSAIDAEARKLADLVKNFSEPQHPGDADPVPPVWDCEDISADVIIDPQASGEEHRPVAAVPAGQPPAPEPVVVKLTLAERVSAFIHIDRLPVRQRLALFA